MIKGIIVHNQNRNESLSRTISSIDAKHALELFLSQSKETQGSFVNEYQFVYKTTQDSIIACITDYPPHCVFDILSKIDSSFPSNLFLIDEIMNEFGVDNVNNDIETILKMDSKEDKPVSVPHFESKTKNTKEEENKILERVRQLELEVRSEPVKVESVNPKKIFKERNVDEELSEINIYCKQHVRMDIDRDGAVLKGEVDGDLSLKIMNENFKNVEIFYNSPMDLKSSPNLVKGLENIIKCNKEWPINRQVALLKWKSVAETLPFTFTFWPSELNDDRFSILFEISCDVTFKNLIIYFNLENVKDVRVESNNADVKDMLVWNVSNLEEGSSDTLEFTCRCDTVDSLFPIEIFFDYEEKSPIKIVGVKNEGENVEYKLTSIVESNEVKIS